MDNIKNVLIGSTGLAASSVAPMIQVANDLQIETLLQSVVQVVIAIVTIIGIFKKKR